MGQPPDHDAERLSTRRRMLYASDLNNEVDAKRAEHRITAELVTDRARLFVGRILRRLRRARHG